MCVQGDAHNGGGGPDKAEYLQVEPVCGSPRRGGEAQRRDQPRPWGPRVCEEFFHRPVGGEFGVVDFTWYTSRILRMKFRWLSEPLNPQKPRSGNRESQSSWENHVGSREVIAGFLMPFGKESRGCRERHHCQGQRRRETDAQESHTGV